MMNNKLLRMALLAGLSLGSIAGPDLAKMAEARAKPHEQSRNGGRRRGKTWGRRSKSLKSRSRRRKAAARAKRA